MAFDPLDPYDVDGFEVKSQEAQEKAKQSRMQAEEDFRFLMRQPQGRRYFRRLLDRTGVYRTTFRPNSEGPFLEGVRSIGVTVLADMHKLAMAETILMMQEMQTDE